MSTMLRTTLGLIGLAASATAQAQSRPPAEPDGLSYRLGITVEHSDNMARRPVAIADTAIAPTLGFAYLVRGARGEFEAAGDVTYRNYVENRFDNELNQSLGANGRWIFIPERLSWVFQGSVADQPLDPFRVDAPDNRQRTSVFLTGPTLAIRPAPTLRMLGELRYMHTAAEQTPEFDGSRLGAAIRTLYEIGPLQTLSGEIESFDVDFDLDTVAIDYRRDDAFLRYSQQGARGEWNADVGYSRVRFDRALPGTSRTESQPLVRLRAAHDLGEITRFELDVQRSFGDSAQDLLDGAPRAEDYALPIGRTSMRNAFLTPDLFLQTGGRAGLARRDESLYLRLDGQWRRQEYLRVTGLDQTIRGLSVSANRQVRATFSIGAQAEADWRRFQAIDRRDRDTRLALFANWQTSRRTGLSLELSRNERQSTDNAQDYDDNRIVLSFNLVR